MTEYLMARREVVVKSKKVLWRVVLAALIGLCLSFSQASCLWAQDEENADGDDLVSTNQQGLVSADVRSKRVSKGAGKLSKIPEQAQSLSHLPPMLAVRGLADSAQIKKVIRSMLTSQIPVMYQTMTMVENGAFAGFAGSMDTVPGFLDNVTNSAQLELALKEITDPEGAEALGYVNAVHTGMKQQSPQQGQNLWPVGIFYASGDLLDEQPLQDSQGFKIQQLPIKHPDGGSTKLDALSQDSGQGVQAQSVSGFNSGLRVMQSAPSSGSQRKLSDILWSSSQNSQSQEFGTDIEFQTKIVGDLTIDKGDAQQDKPISTSEMKFVEPTETVQDANASGNQGGANGGGDGQLRGFYFLRHEKKKKLWEETYRLMGKYCLFKSNNTNHGKRIFQKLTPASEFTPELLKNSSSQSFKWTVNLLDIFFKTWVETRSSDPSKPTTIDCDFQGRESAAESMPVKYVAPTNQFDNCKTKPKECARNRWMLRLVELIAEDRVITDFKDWHEAALNQALGQHPWIAIKVEELMCTSLMAERSGGRVALCDPNLYLEKIAEDNRQSWIRVVGDLSKMAQNAVGSASFRPQQNSVHNGTGGATQASTTGP